MSETVDVKIFCTERVKYSVRKKIPKERTLTIKQRGLFRMLRLGGMPPRMAYETAKSFTPKGER